MISQSDFLTDGDLDRNYDAFKLLQPSLAKTHAGQQAVIRDAALVGVFATVLEAYGAAWARFDDDRFSIQPVDDEPVHLGFYSIADHFRAP